MTYRNDVGQLARALADLLDQDDRDRAPRTAPVQAAPLPAAQPPAAVAAALACRDTVVGAVRDLTGALLRSTPPPVRASPDLLVRSPAHALHAALRDLQPVGDRDLSLIDALAVPAGPPVAGWQRAARAAAALERYGNDAAALPGPAAWSLARDLAALTSVVTALDRDLAATVTAADLTGAAVPAGVVDRLLDDSSHGLLQLAADQLNAHTADIPFGAAALPGRHPRPVQSVTRLADLPSAGQQLAELLRPRGAHLTIREVRAALRAVTYGVDLGVRVLAADRSAFTSPVGRTGAGGPVDDHTRTVQQLHDDAIGQLRGALPDLQHLLHSQLATLTPPAPGVLFLSQQIQTRLTAAGGLHEQLQERAVAAANTRPLGQLLARWALTAAPVLEAVRDGLSAAADSRALLAARDDRAPARYGTLLWLPLQPTDAQAHPALSSADRAAGRLNGAATLLSSLLRASPTGPASAFEELSAALRARAAPPTANPVRTAHPTLPRDISRRQARSR